MFDRLAAHGPPTPRNLSTRTRRVTIGAGLLGTAAIAAVLLASPLPASATHTLHSAHTAVLAPAGPSDDGRLKATFTDSDVSVTPGLGMVELILTGTGTVQGFGAATDVVGVVEDFAASPCGHGGASNSAQQRLVIPGGVLELSSTAMNCVTASGPRVTGTYRVDGQASTGIFAGARGTGRVTVDVATGQDTLSGTLILIQPDSGLAGCTALSSTHHATATGYSKIRAQFAGSRWPDLRTAGTAYADLATQLRTARGTDGYQAVWFYQRLAAACARHGRALNAGT